MNIPNGAGLYVPQNGFSVPDGSGYTIRKRSGGCQPIWPGFFMDTFNYTSSASAHDTALAPYWTVVPDGLANYAMETDPADGYLISTGVGPTEMYPSCGVLPLLADQFAKCISQRNGVTNHPNDGTPRFAGGPAILLNTTGTKGYKLTAYNEFYDAGGGDFRHSLWIQCTVMAGNAVTGATLYKMLTGGSGFNSVGWNESFVPMLITAEVGSVLTSVNVYYGLTRAAPPVISFVDTGSGRPLTGRIGMVPDTNGILSFYVGGDLATHLV